jgi:uncharacterized protein
MTREASMVWTRRQVVGVILLAALGASAGSLAEWVTRPAASDQPVEVAWEQLIPRSGWFERAAEGTPMRGIVQHGQLAATPGPTLDEAELVRDYDGRRVRIAGYIVPIGFDGVGVREFLLVPYVGACIHVPPPPPNQVVLVRSERRVPVRDQFEPVLVTGTFATGMLSTELAEVGYQVAAEAVTSYAGQ